MKNIKILAALVLTVFLIYFLFFRISWKLIESGNVEKIEKHLKYKVKTSLNSSNKGGYALFNVILKSTSKNDNYNLVKTLLEKDLKKKRMISPYESIVEGLGEIDEAKLAKLEKLGNLLKNYGFTSFPNDSSLLKALEKKEYGLFETLLKAGVNVNQKNDLGETAIFYIIKNQYKYEDELNKTMEKLGLQELPDKEKLAELFRKDEKGEFTTELLTIKKATNFYEDSLWLLDLLNEFKANPNISNNEGVMPIEYVFRKNNRIYFNKLIKFKTPVDFKEYGNYKIIFDGIKNGNPLILNELYKKRFDLYQKNEKNETVLNFIIREEKLNVLQILLNRNILNNEHKTFVFKHYLEEEDVKALKKINNLGLFIENPQLVFQEKIKKYTKIDILVYFIDLQVDINARDEKGDTPLIHAVKKENEPLFNLLILRKADMNLQDINGDTPLILSVKNGNEYFVQELVNKGAKTDIKNNKGEDAMFYAKKMEKFYKLLKNKPKDE